MKSDEPSAADASAQPWVFATTHWSVVLKVGQEDSAQAILALEQLCRTYWYPLYAYVRRLGYTEHDAQDLIQGFFVLLLKRQALHNLVPGRGKFRSFLLTALNRFLHDEHDRRQAQKRGGGQPVISLDAQEAEQRYRMEPPDTETPEKLFDRRWAMTLIDGALHRLQQKYAADNNAPLFEQLRGYIVEGRDNRPYAEVARQIGINEDAVKKAVQRLRRRFRETVLEEIAQTVHSRDDIDGELRHLLSVLSS